MGESFTVDRSQAGARLDLLLADHLGVSRGAARRLIAEDVVRLAGRPPRKGAKVAAGELVEVLGEVDPTPRPQPQGVVPELARGEGWLIVDKPAGMPVHPLTRHETATVTNVLVARHPEMVGVGEGGLRSGVVHRLDVTTSGCLIVATAEEAWHRLRAAFAEHRTRKIYHALVEGDVPGAGASTLQLSVAQHHPAKVAVVRAGGTACNLSWRPLQRLGDRTLVEVTLGTGFLHQVRVMLAHHGHPIVGDKLYGARLAATRPLLHAAELTVEDAHAVAPTPADLPKHLRPAAD